jgi:hypothetical protein
MCHRGKGMSARGVEESASHQTSCPAIEVRFQCRAIAQAVSRRLFNAAALVHTQLSPLGFVVDKVTLGQVFPKDLRFSLVNIISLLLHIHLCTFRKMDSGSIEALSRPTATVTISQSSRTDVLQ